MKLTYREQLMHPLWQRRRLERLQVAEFTCESCQDSEKTLHVHHRHYVSGRMAWQYTDNELRVVCENCHAIEHFERAAVMAALLMTHAAVGEIRLAALIAGYLSVANPIQTLEPAEVTGAREAWPETYEAGILAARLEIDERAKRYKARWKEISSSDRAESD